MTILENLEKEIATEKANGVDSYLFAVQYTNETVSVVEVAIAEILSLVNMFTVARKNGNTQLKFKATKQVKELLKKYETVATFDTATVEKMNSASEKINRGHCIEMLLFGYTETEVLASQSKIDGVFNGKNVQVKSSLISFSETGKNNGTSAATIVKKVA